MKTNRHHRKGGAFTLVEIVVAMTILALVSGTVMAILMQAGDVAADIRDTDRKDEELSRFLDLLGQTIESLPSESTIEMIPASESVSGFPEMKITDAVGAFIFGEDIGTAGELIIGIRPQSSPPDGGDSASFLELAISRESYSPEDTDGDGMVIGAGSEDFLTPDSEGRYWLPLVSGILEANWRYWDESSQEWLTEWEEDTLPPLMELVVEDSYRPAPIRTVYELPDHLVNGDDAKTTPTNNSNSNTTSSTTLSSSRPQSGGRAAPGGQGAAGRGGDGRRGGGAGPPRGNGPRGARGPRGGGGGGPRGPGGGGQGAPRGGGSNSGGAPGGGTQ